MAVDTRNKRASAIGIGLPTPTVWPNPDGTLDAADRVHSAYLYAGLTVATGGGSIPGPVPAALILEIEIFNRFGRAIGQVRPLLSFVTWKRNKFGRADMLFASSDSKATEEFLKFGNQIRIRFDNGLPDWGGSIEPPRQWRPGDGTIGVTAYSGEYLLTFRQTDKGRYFTNANIGAIAQALVVEANAIRDTGISIGAIWGGGDTHSPEYHFDNLYEVFTRSLFGRLSDNDFDVKPFVTGGILSFVLYVYERRGADKDNVALHEGFNISADSELIEQGTITTSWTAIGDGDGWGDSRPTATASNAAAIERYGLRENAQIMQGVVSPSTLQTAVDVQLAETKQPKNLFRLIAVNRTPGLFAQYDIGDSVRAELPSFGFGGFDGLVRVLARSFTPSTGECELVVEEQAS